MVTSLEYSGLESRFSNEAFVSSDLKHVGPKRAGLHEILVSWIPNNEPDIDHYNVYRSISPDFECNYEILIASPSDNNYLDWGLNPQLPITRQQSIIIE